LENLWQKSLKKGLATSSHQVEATEVGGLLRRTSSHSASKRGPKSGSDRMEVLSFQYDSGRTDIIKISEKSSILMPKVNF
jgi:hypothetical protein